MIKPPFIFTILILGFLVGFGRAQRAYASNVSIQTSVTQSGTSSSSVDIQTTVNGESIKPIYVTSTNGTPINVQQKVIRKSGLSTTSVQIKTKARTTTFNNTKVTMSTSSRTTGTSWWKRWWQGLTKIF